MRVLLLLCVSALCVPAGTAQAFRVTTDRPAYAYGEPIRVTASLNNPGPDTLKFALPGGGPHCSRQLAFDGFSRWDVACVTAYIDFDLPPRTRLDWIYTLPPSLTGFPNRDGTHTLRIKLDGYRRPGYAPLGYADSASFQAPAYRGGTVRVVYSLRDSLRVWAVRDSLRARVLTNDVVQADGQGRAQWQVEGEPLAAVVARYAADPRFRSFAADHQLHSRVYPMEMRFVGVADGSAAADDRLAAPAPNPFAAHTTLTFTPATAGPVRAEAFDALGRRVAVLYEGEAAPGVPLPLVLSGSALRPGLYLVRVTTSAGVWNRHVLRAAD
jgi:hypothetical protein